MATTLFTVTLGNLPPLRHTTLNPPFRGVMQKTPTSTETYFNKGKDVERLLKLVSDNFLDGQAIKD